MYKLVMKTLLVDATNVSVTKVLVKTKLNMFLVEVKPFEAIILPHVLA